MQEQRSLCWRLNWYRQSELEGALLLGRIVRHVTNPRLVCELTRHCADEARHAWMWDHTRQSLALPTVRILRSYQSFYVDEIGAPRKLVDVLLLTHVFERRVHRHFAEELRRRDLPDAVRRTLVVMMRDEVGHLEWVGRWLAGQPDIDATMLRYEAADERIAQGLAPFRERLWDVPGLGEEMSGDHDGCCDAKERDAAQCEHPAQAGP